MSQSRPLRVTKIEVFRLFGLYDHAVVLNTDERVTIIHGPNGVGKTALLRMVHALFSGRLDECLRTKMGELRVTLSDGTVCGLRPSAEAIHPALAVEGDGSLRGEVFCISEGAGKEESVGFNQRELQQWASKFSDESPYVVRLDTDRWVDRRDEVVLSSTELLTRYEKFVPPDVRARISNEPEWFRSIRQRVGVHIIETQRLLRFGRIEAPYARSKDAREYTSTVKDYARDLAKRIRDALTVYAREAQKLDQTYPQRLLVGPQRQFSIDSVKQDMHRLDEKRERLMKLGLLDKNYSYPFNTDTLDRVDVQHQSAMNLYVEDTAAKLRVFDDLALRIEALLKNVNEKFRNTKIDANRDEGLTARTSSGARLELDALSSGEQHELVLLYDLLFKVSPNALILIDEPELSLHISWQKRFLDDLLQIVQISSCDVLLATHSIFIAGDRPDLMVALSEAELDN